MDRRSLIAHLPAAAALPAAAGAKPANRIDEAVMSMEIVNTHEHILPEDERTSQPVDFFTLAGHYAINDVISAGLSGDGLALVRNQKAAAADRWRAFEPYWKCARLTGYGQALRIAVRDIYGVSEISSGTIGRINDAIRAQNRPGLYRRVLKERAKIRFSVLDDYWNRAPVKADPEFFVLARKFDQFIMPADAAAVGRMQEYTGVSVTSLHGLEQAMEKSFEQSLAAGMVTVKSTAAYNRQLLFREVTSREASADFDALMRNARPQPQGFRARVERPYRNLEDYMFHHMLRLAGAHRVPVQIHTGLHAGNGNFIRNSNPTHLTNLFFLYPRVQFDLFHMSYPYQHELAVLAKIFPNVHADLCWAYIISPAIARAALHEFLETVPANKIMAFGGDYRYPELSYAHSVMARRNVARVLNEKVTEGFCTELEAVEVARMILHDNPARLFAARARSATPAAAALAGNALQPATLAVVGARIWTGNPRQPWAQAIAVRGATILAVGGNDTIRKLAGPDTRIIYARGQMIVPGFIDSHIHFLEGGLRLSSVQLRDARTRAEFVARLRDFAAAAPPGAWITGGDWDHELWGGELPRRGWIDAVTPNHPVWVNRLDGHMALANSLALAAAKVTRGTAEVDGGAIVRDQSGEPTGILKDNAMSLVARVIPDRSPEMTDRALEAAMRYVAARGVTSVHHMGSWNDLAAFQRAHRNKKLRTRIYAAVPLATWHKLDELVKLQGRGDDWLRIGALKGFVDGSLGSRTAAFFEPFNGSPGDRGLFVNTPGQLYDWTYAAARAGLHVMVHAIGDRAIRTQLAIFERVRRELNLEDPRFRIEHAQHISPADIPRFGALGVIPSMQPYHAIDDGRWAGKVIGPERIKTTYAFRTLLDTGAKLAFGSDWYVAPPSPLEGIYAAVTRATLDDRNPGGWVPEQKITVEEALRTYTSAAAYAAFEEDRKGALEAGKLADFAMIDRDLTRIPPHQIRSARVTMTVLGGEIIHEIR